MTDNKYILTTLGSEIFKPPCSMQKKKTKITAEGGRK